MRRLMILVPMIFLAAGCAMQADRSSQMQRQVDDMIAVYGPACEKLGYAKGSDAWRDCVLRLNSKDTIARYSTAPTTTTCSGHRGLFHCSTL